MSGFWSRGSSVPPPPTSSSQTPLHGLMGHGVDDGLVDSKVQGDYRVPSTGRPELGACAAFL